MRELERKGGRDKGWRRMSEKREKKEKERMIMNK